jgi:hypothetical protein
VEDAGEKAEHAASRFDIGSGRVPESGRATYIAHLEYGSASVQTSANQRHQCPSGGEVGPHLKRTDLRGRAAEKSPFLRFVSSGSFD